MNKEKPGALQRLLSNRELKVYDWNKVFKTAGEICLLTAVF